MTFLEIINKVPEIFNWYFKLKQINRLRINYIAVLIASWVLLYFNDKTHRENTIIYSARVERSDSLRAKEQSEYKKNLEYYTEKFLRFSEVILDQNKKIEQIKQEP